MRVKRAKPQKNYEIRKGPGYRWSLDDGYTHTTGYTVDNLDTKSADDADYLFEKLFVDIREELEAMSSFCLDNDDERLQVCHTLSRFLSQSFSKYKS